jgi:hypothetical protein
MGLSIERLHLEFEGALEIQVLFHYAKRVLDCILAILFQQAFIEWLANLSASVEDHPHISLATKVRPSEKL